MGLWTHVGPGRTTPAAGPANVYPLHVKSTLAYISVIGLLGASGLVAWSVIARPDATLLTSEQANSFDLKEGPPPDRPAPRAQSAGEELHDAVAAPPVSPRPILYEGVAAAAPRASFAPAPAPVPSSVKVTPQMASAVRGSRLFNAFLGAPARYLVASSALKSPSSLRAFLGDSRAVDSYMNSSLMRAALNSPSVAKAVLGNPAVVRAFLASPALRDPQTVRALLSSPMVMKMMDCPGIQDALADPAVIKSLATDPGTIAWISQNPEALRSLASAAPGLAKSLTR